MSEKRVEVVENFDHFQLRYTHFDWNYTIPTGKLKGKTITGLARRQPNWGHWDVGAPLFGDGREEEFYITSTATSYEDALKSCVRKWQNQRRKHDD